MKVWDKLDLTFWGWVRLLVTAVAMLLMLLGLITSTLLLWGEG